MADIYTNVKAAMFGRFVMRTVADDLYDICGLYAPDESLNCFVNEGYGCSK